MFVVCVLDFETTCWVSTNQDARSETDCHAHPHGHERVPIPNGGQSGKNLQKPQTIVTNLQKFTTNQNILTKPQIFSR